MRPALALLPLAALLAAAAAAQTRHDTTAPINFGADHMELQDKSHRALLTGAVVVTQGEMTLDSQRMTVAYTGEVLNGQPQVSRLDAAGDVVVRRPDQTARGNFGTYDLDRHLITMVGAVSLTQGTNTVNGGRLTLNLDTGRAVVDAAAVTGGTGATATRSGRVTGTFSVPPRNDAAGTAPAARPTPTATPSPAHP